MNTRDGHVTLDRLHQFAKKHPDCYLRPRPEGSGILLSEYSNLCKETVSEISLAGGIYLWGSYNPRGQWKNIYVGCTRFGKTASLRARILEELRDEKCSVWAKFLGDDAILGMNDSGRRNRRRSIRKKGVTHIFWVATPDLSNHEVREVESELIEALNPEANHQKSVPAPYQQGVANRVFRILRKQIHIHRPKIRSARGAADYAAHK
jgi:hypothetical protein